eukprot:TRINITY_DN26319_c0_g1_i1.p1 TRINITY_DN26319_c0_g1~~TRINITY_DN26319_c0_g1_i1.p1  ORF type:complete len:425 (+),score=86.57 TRINITY_DN26319_c0_g1_i1:50-1276(+)
MVGHIKWAPQYMMVPQPVVGGMCQPTYPPVVQRQALTLGCLPVPFDVEKVNNAEKGGTNPLVEVVKNLDKWGITVTDPLEKRKVACPLFKIWVTNGLLDSSAKSHTHSICILYQNGRCKVENNCNQIHVDRLYYAQQRTGVPCCAEHYDFFTSSLLTANVVQLPVVILIVTLKGVRTAYIWPSNLISLSLGLAHCPVKRIDGRDCMIIESSRVCQVWQGARCSYGKECNYVHLCRRVYEQLPKDPPAHRIKKAPSSANSSASTTTLTPPTGALVGFKQAPLATLQHEAVPAIISMPCRQKVVDFVSIPQEHVHMDPVAPHTTHSTLRSTESMEDLVSHLPLNLSRESSPIAPIDEQSLLVFASKFQPPKSTNKASTTSTACDSDVTHICNLSEDTSPHTGPEGDGDDE